MIRVLLDDDGQFVVKKVFFDNTPGYPDNLSVDEDGTVWIGLSLSRQEIVDVEVTALEMTTYPTGKFECFSPLPTSMHSGST